MAISAKILQNTLSVMQSQVDDINGIEKPRQAEIKIDIEEKKVEPKKEKPKGEAKRKINHGTKRNDGKISISVLPNEEDWQRWKDFFSSRGQSLNSGIIYAINDYISQNEGKRI